MKQMPSESELWSRFPTQYLIDGAAKIRATQSTFKEGSKEWAEGNARAEPLEREIARRQAQ